MLCPSCAETMKEDSETCATCGRRVKKGTLKLDKIDIAKINNKLGIFVEGPSNLFLLPRKTEKAWKIQLFDLKDQSGADFGEPLTSEMNFRDPNELKTKKGMNLLRNKLKEFYTNHEAVLERIVTILQYKEGDFFSPDKKKEDKTEKPPEFSEKVKVRAEEILRDPAFFYKLGRVFEKGFLIPKLDQVRFIIGEHRTKRLLGPLLIGAARLNTTTILKLYGSGATAKDTLVRMWLTLLDPALKHIERSHITPGAFRYSDNLKLTDILYIPDSPELQGELGRSVRFMRADDGGFETEYTIKDPDTGEFTTKIVKMPIKGIITTSNELTTDLPLKSGMLEIKTDDSKWLSCKVIEHQCLQIAGTRPTFPPEELEAWRCAFYILSSEKTEKTLSRMIIPYAVTWPKFLDGKRSTDRRSAQKLRDVVEVVAWTRRFQKPEDQRNIADFVDYYTAFQLGFEILVENLGNMSDKEFAILKIVGAGIEANEPVTVKYVSEQTNIPQKTCYKYLELLLEKGLLSKDKEGYKNVYRFMGEAAEIASSSEKELAGILRTKNIKGPTPKELAGKILASLREKNLLPELPEGKMEFVDPITGKVLILNNHEVKEEIVAYEHPYERCPGDSWEAFHEAFEEELKPAKDEKPKLEKKKKYSYRAVSSVQTCEKCSLEISKYSVQDHEANIMRNLCEGCFSRFKGANPGEWKETSK